MDPFEIVKAIIPSLNEKQKQEILNLLGAGICVRQGHKFKKVGEKVVSVWKPPVTRMVCSVCGEILDC